MENRTFRDIEIYSEVLQDAVLDLIDLGIVRSASGSALTLSHKGRRRFFNEIYRYKEKIVLRPVEISNSPEVIRRLGVFSVNTAIEVDIYGHVNSTHVMGSQMMNGIGGSGDFLRAGGGHEPHILEEAFSFHNRFWATGDMRRYPCVARACFLLPRRKTISDTSATVWSSWVSSTCTRAIRPWVSMTRAEAITSLEGSAAFRN